MINRVFLDHPATVNETFLQHSGFALRFAGSLFVASMAAFIHAVIPCLFEKTASRIVGQLYDRMNSRVNK